MSPSLHRRSIPPLLAAALCLPLAVTATAAAASTSHLARTRHFVVTTTADQDATNAATGHCVTANGHCSLRAAIDIANSLSVPVSITVPPGTYQLTEGALYVLDPAGVWVTGRSSASTVIKATFDRVFVVTETGWFGGTSDVGSRLSLSDLAVVNGLAPSVGTDATQGGGIVVADTNDSLVATRVRFQNDQAPSIPASVDSGQGGAIMNDGTTVISQCSFVADSAGYRGGAIAQIDSALSVEGSTFSSDTTTNLADPSTGSQGGAIYTDAPAQITGSTFAGDAASAPDASGGAVYARETTTLDGDRFVADRATSTTGTGTAKGGAVYVYYGPSSMIGTSFTGNRAVGGGAYGGAIYAAAPVQLLDAHLSGNSATGSSDASGGAIYVPTGTNQGSGTLVVTASTFSSNRSTSPSLDSGQTGGGAVYDGLGSMFTAVSFTANRATNGGGGAIFNEGNGLTVRDSTFTGNVATGGVLATPSGPGFGGALDLYDASTVTDSTFTSNHAQWGGGAVYSDDANIVNNSLLKSNSAYEGGAFFLDWTVFGSRDAIIDNTATLNGGGILVRNNNGDSANLSGSVIAGNVAAFGPGIELGEYATTVTGTGVYSGDYIVGNHTPGGAPAECFYRDPLGEPAATGTYGNVVGDSTCQLTGGSDRIGTGQQGYWFASAAGSVKAINAPALGGAAGIAAIAAGPGNDSYWTVSKSGAVHGKGVATYGSATGRLAGGTAVAIVATLDRRGYWVASSTGAVVALGDAPPIGEHLGLHVVGMARSVDAKGCLLLTAAGRVVTLGDARSFGSHPGIAAAGIAMTPDGQGYWIATTTGTVMHFGDAKSYGSSATTGVIGIASGPTGRGYLLFTSKGKVLSHGSAHSSGGASGSFAAVAAT